MRYRDKDGKWVTNIIQVDQKTDPTWWDELINADGKINDIGDTQKARTAFAVNGNHSNDATIVKNFHLWGRANGVDTSTVHDAFFTNISDMAMSRKTLLDIYTKALDNNSTKATLDEMLARGLPRDLYNKYLNEAIDIGLIPIAGRSKINGKIVTEDDILKKSDMLKTISDKFNSNYGWYGVG